MKRVIIHPRKRKISFNEIEINAEKNENNFFKINDNDNKYRTSSPIVIEKKNLTPTYSSRRLEQNYNLYEKQNDKTNREKNNKYYNLKDKPFLLSNNNTNVNINNSNSNSNTKEKNIFEELLLEDVKNTDDSSNKSINNLKKEKDIKEKNNNSITFPIKLK